MREHLVLLLPFLGVLLVQMVHGIMLSSIRAQLDRIEDKLGADEDDPLEAAIERHPQIKRTRGGAYVWDDDEAPDA